MYGTDYIKICWLVLLVSYGFLWPTTAAQEEDTAPLLITDVNFSPVKLYDREYNEIDSISARSFRRLFTEHEFDGESVKGIKIITEDRSLGMYQVNIEEDGSTKEAWILITQVVSWPAREICPDQMEGEAVVTTITATLGVGGARCIQAEEE